MNIYIDDLIFVNEFRLLSEFVCDLHLSIVKNEKAQHLLLKVPDVYICSGVFDETSGKFKAAHICSSYYKK